MPYASSGQLNCIIPDNSSNRPRGYGWSNMQVITFDTTQHYSNLWNSLIFIRATYADLFKVLLFSQELEELVKTNYMLGNPCQLCYYKLIAWLFGRLVIKWPLTLGRFVEFPRASPSVSTNLARVTGPFNH